MQVRTSPCWKRERSIHIALLPGNQNPEHATRQELCKWSQLGTWNFSCEWHLPCPTWNGSRIWHRKSSARWALCLVTISRMHMSLPSPGPVKNEPVVHNAPHPVHDTVHMPAGLCEGAGCNGKTVKW